MPLKPHTRLSRRGRPVLATVVCAATVAWLTGCATERLVAGAPQGMDLSGEWKINWNLSDDPQKLGEETKGTTPMPEHGHRGNGGGGGFGKPGMGGPGGMGGPSGPGAGGLDPGGGGDLTRNDARDDESQRDRSQSDESYGDHAQSDESYDDQSGRDAAIRTAALRANARSGNATGFLPVLYTAQSDGTKPAASGDSTTPAPAAKKDSRDGGLARMLDSPELLTISQSGNKITVKSGSDTDEYTAGETATAIPFGIAGAERTSGWRDTIFVVITKAKKGPSKEDDFTLDSEGHLIFATLATHTRKGNIDFKRVYDRVRKRP